MTHAIKMSAWMFSVVIMLLHCKFNSANFCWHTMVEALVGKNNFNKWTIIHQYFLPSKFYATRNMEIALHFVYFHCSVITKNTSLNIMLTIIHRAIIA